MEGGTDQCFSSKRTKILEAVGSNRIPPNIMMLHFSKTKIIPFSWCFCFPKKKVEVIVGGLHKPSQQKLMNVDDTGELHPQKSRSG